MFTSEAFAAELNSDMNTSFIGIIPWVLILLVMYFLILRPQQKRLKEHRKTIDSIKRGDVVITSGGIVGEVNKVDEVNSYFIIEIAPKIEVKVLKSAISEVLKQKTQIEVKSEKDSRKSKNKQVENDSN
ncbi:MAG: preprotein translocase subunit YajC [Wolbachia endosymbiont of Fragariocoptes setiger]|nr:preprotein translocase subunit YajC [Wolbachia endosymbiont of Fragariocoptes setiger]